MKIVSKGRGEDKEEPQDPPESQTERELDRLQTFLEITFANIEQGITIYDADLRLIAWNQKYVEMGIVPEEGLRYGASLIDYYHQLARIGTFGPGDPVELAERHIRSVRGGGPEFIPTEILTPDNGRQIRIERFPMADGGICATFTDVSEEKRLREAMVHSQKLDELGKLISGNVHDVTNRAQVVQGFLELAKSDADVDKKNTYIDQAMSAVEDVRKMAASVLKYGQRKPSRAMLCNLHEITGEWVSVFEKLLGSGVSLQMRSSPTLPMLTLDRWQYQNCLLNLVNNAQDAVGDEGQITLDLTRVGDEVLVTCEDDGKGIEAERLEHVVEPHFTTKSDAGGTGLGLYMVDNFCKQFGGRLLIESAAGQGSRITMCLPILQQER